MSTETLRAKAAAYYSEKLGAHGPTPKGVDWNGQDSQELRFRQLMRVFENDGERFRLLDFGCGYGALVDFLASRVSKSYDYVGYDASQAMVDACREKFPARSDLHFTADWDSVSAGDYSVASGLFNVKQETPEAAWQEYILDTLKQLDAKSARGWSANFLTSYSDRPLMKDYLHYADPLQLFDWCKRNCSRQVALLHDYGLYEFTLIVRKQGPGT